MNLLYFFAIIYLILSEINFASLKDIGKLTRSRNSAYISSENSDELENYRFMFCKDEEYLHKFISHDNKSQMIWVTWNRTKAGERAVLPNICSAENGQPLRRRCQQRDNGRAQWQFYNSQADLIDCRISMFCQSEPFQHYVIQNNGELQLHQNVWKRAKTGEYSSLRDICLQTNGLHLTRKCFYDVQQQRAKWSSVAHLKDFKCLQHTRQEIISKELNILHENITTSNWLLRDKTIRSHTTKTLLNLLEKPKAKLLPADVQLTSEIMKTIVTDTQDAELSSDILKITHNLMSTDPVVLRMSAEVNATNSLLETFENYMDALTEQLASNCQVTLPTSNGNFSVPLFNKNDTSVELLNLTNIGVYAHLTRNISVFYVNPNCAHISGIAIYNSYQMKKHMTQQQKEHELFYDSYNQFYYRFIYMNESISDLLQETHLELASFIPNDLWTSLGNKSFAFTNTPVIVFKIYGHDGLFVEQYILRTRKPFSKILSISIPGFEAELPTPLPFILRNKSPTHTMKPSSNTGCGYWNYSTWTSTGVHTNSSHISSSSDLILCSTNHLTQFSYLLGGGFRQNDLSDEILVTGVHQEALDIISLIGCTLSLLGLLGIWITALLFKSWRSQASNKVLLNMCVALTLQMVLFLFVNTDDVSEALVENHSYTKCVVLGALLQYSILVLFTWMLIVAFLQFQRYVTVIGIQRPKHYIIKSAIIAWSLPLIPTLLVAFLDSKSYIPSNYQLATDTGICYPSGSGLHFGVILPVSIIVVANLSIFLYVLYSISHTLSMSMQHNEKQMVLKQIRLSVLLFFLLGLSWIFGIFAFIKAGIVFSYLFCLTATLQGFVLFIYFVIIDENARTSWQNLLCFTRAKKRVKKVAELQSMTTATTSLTHDMSSSRDH